MWPNTQGTVDLVRFTEEIPNGKPQFLYIDVWVICRASFDLLFDIDQHHCLYKYLQQKSKIDGFLSRGLQCPRNKEILDES